MNIMYDDGKRLSKVFESKVYQEYCWSKGIGCIGTNEPSGALVCGGYYIPAELTDEQILEAIEKSVKDNHDYLYDLVAKPENKVVYEPGCDY